MRNQNEIEMAMPEWESLEDYKVWFWQLAEKAGLEVSEEGKQILDEILQSSYKAGYSPKEALSQPPR